jgi:hypothetical protein
VRVALALFAFALLSGLAVAGVRPLTPVRFERGAGWLVGAGRVHACPGVPRSRCVQVGSRASTVRWRDCAECAVPHHTLAHLRANGIAIFLLLARERHRVAHRLDWPPRLHANDVRTFEGVPTRIGTIARGGDLHGFPAQLFVYFGRPHPSARQLVRAERELASARLPWARLPGP